MAPRSKSKCLSTNVPKESKEFILESQPLSLMPSTGEFLTQEFFFQMFNDFKQEIKEFVLELYDDLKSKIDQMKANTFAAVSALSDYSAEIENKLESLEEANFNLTTNIQILQQKIRDTQEQLVMINFNKKAFAIRVRGFREKERENLKQTFVEAFSHAVGSPGLNFDWQIRKIYRQNSLVAEQRQLPRDIIIYFSTKESRNAIMQKFHNNSLRVDDQDLIVFKEIPFQMLRARRDYAFLTKELRNQQIQYRWEAPAGITVTFENQRLRLNSVSEARDFYYKTLKAGLPDSLGKEERQAEGEGKQQTTWLQDGGGSLSSLGEAEKRRSRI